MIIAHSTELRNLSRHCAVCGKKLAIVVYPNRTYKGGHFFGKIDSHGRSPWSSLSSLRGNESKASPTARSRGPRLLKIEIGKKKKAEYWECNHCYAN